MKLPSDARVVQIIAVEKFLIALGADGSLWSACIEASVDGNGDAWLKPSSDNRNGWCEMDGPFSYDPDGNEWTDDEAPDGPPSVGTRKD